jgi:hypothetical protein
LGLNLFAAGGELGVLLEAVADVCWHLCDRTLTDAQRGRLVQAVRAAEQTLRRATPE